ncbi:MAG: DUF1080 domain-containing protein, partial [Planctomycetota bacterium]
MMNRNNICVALGCCILLVASLEPVANADEFTGDWSLDLDSGTPAWMRVSEVDGETEVRFRLHVGSDGPHRNVERSEGKLRFVLRQNKKAAVKKNVEVAFDNGKLTGVILSTDVNGEISEDRFTGEPISPIGTTPPNLSMVKFGHPQSLFNGRDLTGWRPHEADKINGWSVQDGLLVNTTPKTDFSATGAYANLRSEEEFEDFWLHIEFLVEQNRNSGVYLRGMYEAQVVDRDSRMQGKQGVGAIFGSIAPIKNAGRPGGQWQTYDLTLV